MKARKPSIISGQSGGSELHIAASYGLVLAAELLISSGASAGRSVRIPVVGDTGTFGTFIWVMDLTRGTIVCTFEVSSGVDEIFDLYSLCPESRSHFSQVRLRNSPFGP